MSSKRFDHDAYIASGRVIGSIMIANVLVSGAWLAASTGKNEEQTQFMVDNFSVNTNGVFKKGNYHTLITAFFSHRSLPHLMMNSFSLYSFGTHCAYVLGVSQFAFLYLGSGIVSSLAHIFCPYIVPKSWPAHKQYTNSHGLGASGAINGLIMYTIAQSPMMEMAVYGIPLPACVVGLWMVGADVLDLYRGSKKKVGNISHLAGAAFGAMFFFLSPTPYRK